MYETETLQSTDKVNKVKQEMMNNECRLETKRVTQLSNMAHSN